MEHDLSVRRTSQTWGDRTNTADSLSPGTNALTMRLDDSRREPSIRSGDRRTRGTTALRHGTEAHFARRQMTVRIFWSRDAAQGDERPFTLQLTCGHQRPTYPAVWTRGRRDGGRRGDVERTLRLSLHGALRGLTIAEEATCPSRSRPIST